MSAQVCSHTPPTKRRLEGKRGGKNEQRGSLFLPPCLKGTIHGVECLLFDLAGMGRYQGGDREPLGANTYMHLAATLWVEPREDLIHQVVVHHYVESVLEEWEEASGSQTEYGRW